MPDEQNDAKLNPNLASIEELTTLVGVGESLARRIQAGGPYQSQADLLQISGIGDSLLQKISSRLTFESPGEDEPGQDHAGERPLQAANRPRSTPVAGGRPRILLWSLVTAVFSVLLSVGLTLAILLSINGTLNMGRHVRVMDLSDQLAALQRDVADAQTQLRSTDQQLQAIRGLSGRMTDVESALSEATTRMDDARQRVDDMQSTVDELEAASGQLSDRVDRFDQFLNGLRDLLDGDQTAPSSANGPTP
jgi:hypothetical protein